MPVTDVLDEEGVEHQTIQTEKEEDKDKLTLELERIDNAKKIMTNEECENFQAKLLDTLYGSSKWYLRNGKRRQKLEYQLKVRRTKT